MKKFILSIACSLVAFASFAQKTEKQDFAGDNGVKFSVNTTLYEFKQEIQQDVPAAAEYKFTNTGQVPMVIKEVRPGCGCTAPEFPKEPIMPGQTATIKGSYNAKAAGPFMKNMSVTVDGLPSPVTLYLKGTVKAKQ